jgi:hypothetical protein
MGPGPQPQLQQLNIQLQQLKIQLQQLEIQLQQLKIQLQQQLYCTGTSFQRAAAIKGPTGHYPFWGHRLGPGPGVRPWGEGLEPLGAWEPLGASGIL